MFYQKVTGWRLSPTPLNMSWSIGIKWNSQDDFESHNPNVPKPPTRYIGNIMEVYLENNGNIMFQSPKKVRIHPMRSLSPPKWTDPDERSPNPHTKNGESVGSTCFVGKGGEIFGKHPGFVVFRNLNLDFFGDHGSGCPLWWRHKNMLGAATSISTVKSCYHSSYHILLLNLYKLVQESYWGEWLGYGLGLLGVLGQTSSMRWIMVMSFWQNIGDLEINPWPTGYCSKFIQCSWPQRDPSSSDYCL